MRRHLYILLFLIVSQIVFSQVPVTIVKDGNYTVTGTETLEASQSITLKPNTWIQSGSTFLARIVERTTATDPYTPITLSSNQNYVLTRTYQERMPSFNANTAQEGDVIERVTYFDGLGRPMQHIGIKSGAQDKKDIITHIDYDAFGRQDKDWLPYHESTGSIGSYRGDRATATNTYYQNNYPDDFTGVSLANINAYSQKDLEPSPLNRVLKQAAPGKDWKLGNGHEIEFVYQSNTGTEVRYYEVAFNPTSNTESPVLSGGTAYYAAGELHKTITKDENHDGTTSKAHTTEEFKDKQGRVVLKRIYGTSVVGGSSQTNVAHDTFYVYDDFGNLTFVLPPKSEAQGGLPTSSELSELCYQYKYDYRNRLVEKKIPGKGWEYIIYDTQDRPVMTQDANLRAQNQWLFTKYDVFSRVVYTGLHTNTTHTTRSAMQSHFSSTNNTATELYESKVASGTGYDDSYYTNANFPNASITLYTVNYYDDYSFDTDGLSLPQAAEGQTVVNHNNNSKALTRGLATGSRVKVLETSHWITTITGYDDRGRSIYTASKNNYLSTTDTSANKLDFIGKVDKTTITHTKGTNPAITTIDDYIYDHEGRLIRQKQTINDLEEETIVDNTYDNLGQLETKGVGSKSSRANRLQEVDYTYNVRGWLTQINNPAALGSDLFAFKINYNATSHSGTKLYNGNIAETEWRTANTDNGLKWYKYNYDALNRITSGIDHTSNQDYKLHSVQYDKNGNISFLERRGHTNSGATTFGVMDRLWYGYDGNRLLKVSDTGNKTYGFKDGINTGDDYTYDTNGNMLTDANKGISTNITYNHLNLPTQVVLGGGNISYIYDASGVKLEKVVTEGSSVTTTTYAGNYVYEDTGSGDLLKFFNHTEGYVDVNGSGYSYVYQYKDNVGNVRLSYSDSNGNGSIDPSTEILEENSFYPFGLKHKGYNNIINSSNVALDWKFQGQELTEDLGLNVYEWKYRVSDPAIGRFWQIDPLAEDYEWMTTYQFSSNQPIHAPELEGLESMNDLNSRDPNLQGATKEEMAIFNKAQNQALAVSAAVAVDVFVTKGAITRSLLQQTALNTTINGANQLLEGGVENLDFGEALGDAAGNADLFDAGIDAISSKLPGGKIINEVVENVVTSMADVTNDGGFQIGGVNKEMSSVATDLTFSAVTNKVKNVNVPNIKFSGTGLGKSIKNGVIDVVSGTSRNNLPSSNTKPAVGRRSTSERGMNIKVRDNTKVRR